MTSKTGILLLFLAGLGLSCTELSTVTTTENITLKAGQYMSISLTLRPGELVDGSFTVQGPTTLDIKFAVQDPSGRNVYGPVRSRSGSFTYRARSAGVHYLYIDNTYSLVTGKIITLSYTHPRR